MIVESAALEAGLPHLSASQRVLFDTLAKYGERWAIYDHVRRAFVNYGYSANSFKPTLLFLRRALVGSGWVVESGSRSTIRLRRVES